MTSHRASELQVDTNILLRYLTREPTHLAEAARTLLLTAEARGITLLVSPLIVAEVVYVLTSLYGWGREAIVDQLLALLDQTGLTLLESDVCLQALEWYRDVPAVHFADAYIGALSLARGGGHVLSFDRAIRRLPGISVIDAPEQLPA